MKNDFYQTIKVYVPCSSPTKGGSKLDLITNVKSQMTGWLGSGIPIPGLKKNEAPPPEAEQPAPTEPTESEPKAEGKDDDDNSRYNRYEGLADTMSLQLFRSRLASGVLFHELRFTLHNLLD